MTGDGGQGYEPGAGDVVEQDGRRFSPLNWRPPRRGASPVPASPAPALPAPSLAAGTPVLTQGIGSCAAQDGRDLQLGVQVTNQSTADLTGFPDLGQVPYTGCDEATSSAARG